ncbi:MAG: sigma 54-dependent Fis family transcriptional regulator [Oligoflexia bacterium]|nr:sigma 54-dependent Fis family transcriptional regulator [Oligoflexia bacterium]
MSAIKEKEIQDNSQWLKSPLQMKMEGLAPMSEVIISSYFGTKKKLKLYRTYYQIGTDAKADIRIDDPFVSTAHAILELPKGANQYFIKDNASRNGVFLNGVQISQAPLPSRGSIRLGRSTISWSKKSDQIDSFDSDFIVEDEQMKDLISKVQAAASTNLPILLLGETGVGKDRIAQFVHKLSKVSGEFVPINAAMVGGSLAESELFGHKRGAFTGADAVRMGALKKANHGTLFLDEVADLPAETQVKLLRAIETGEIKPLGSDQEEKSIFRMISATSQPLEQLVESKKFRIDLFFRISGIIFTIPPIRERPKDIKAIVENTLAKKGFEIEQEALSKVLSYPWPGNVRELKSCIDRAIALCRFDSCSVIQSKHISGLGKVSTASMQQDKGRSLEEMEREFILLSLERNGWSRSVSAKELGIARSTLFEKMKKYQIQDRV